MAEEDGGLPQAGKDRIFEEITPSIQGGPRKENNPSNRNEFSKERSILSSGFDELHEPSRNSESFSDVQFSSRRQFFDLRKNWADFPTLISGGIKWSQNFYETVLKKHVNFYRLHFLYFIIVDLIGTLLIWLSPPTSLGRISFIDALFNCTSALCVTGLVSVKMNTFSVFNQVVLLFLMLVGGQVFTSLLPVLIRRYYFRKHLLEQEKEASQRRSLPPPPPPLLPPLPPPPPPPSQLPLRPINEQKSLSNLESWTMKEDQNTGNVSVTENVPITNGTDMERATGPRTETGTETETEARRYSMSDEKASLLLRRTPTQTFTERGKPPIPHAHTWGGNTAKALGLEFQQIRKRYFSSPEGVEGEMRESIDYALVDSLQLRSLEYRALQLLSWLIPSYLLGIQLFAFFILRINFWGAPGQRNQLGTYDVSPTFFSAFQTVSAFQNAGFSLLDLNLIPFQKAIVFLTVMGALILLGNTLYAPSLRGIIYSLYCLSKYLEKKGKKRAILLTETLKYLLDHPRKCFTHLFPWHQTLWLVITVIAFNFIETFFLCLFDWNLSVFYGLSGGYKVLDSTFQSLNTRSSGFVVLPLSLISPAMLVLYTGMMYVAVYPVFLSRQTSKADEEVYDDTEIGITPMLEVKDSHLLGQARLLIARDSAYLFLAVFIISAIQVSQVRKDPNFSLFNIIFEVISAYGNVGLSLGYTCPPTAPSTCQSPPYSFSGVWKFSAKLVLVLVMLLGRHRGLPESIDSAIAVPPKAHFRPGLRRALTPARANVHALEAAISRRLSRAASERRPESVFERVSSYMGGRSPSSPSSFLNTPQHTTHRPPASRSLPS